MVELEEPPNMAKSNKPRPDQHTSRFFIRLPEEYRELLQAIQAKYRRPMTIETQIAIERRAKALGIKFKPNFPEDI
jgi:hypothetical protein